MNLLRGCVAWPASCAEEYRRRGYWAGETLWQWLEHLAREYSGQTALVDERRELSYAELLQRSQRLARGLGSRGIQKHDRIVVQLSNRIEWFELCFAAWRLGAIPVLAQPAHRAAEIGHFLAAADAVAYFIDDHFGGFDYRELARDMRSKCPSLREVFVAGDPGPHTSLEQLGNDANETVLPAAHGTVASEVALMQLSGGTTGAPKLIPRTHDDYLYSVRRSAQVCRLDQSTRYLAALPVAHNFPLSSPGALGVLGVGGTVVLSASPAPDVALDWVLKRQINATALVPPLARIWHDAAVRRGISLDRFRLFQIGGAKLDVELARVLYERLGPALQQVFGMAEGLVCYTGLDDSSRVVTETQGRPMSEADEVRIVDDEDRDVASGEVGHLLARGPYTIRGYYHAEDHNQISFTRDGFFRTGDLVRLTPEGCLVVAGRAKDQVNRGGEKISAAEVEAHIRATGLVEDAALVAFADPILGERSCAFVVPLTASVDARTLRSALRARGLADYKLPDRVVRLSTLPKTAVGKIDKVSLRSSLRAP